MKNYLQIFTIKMEYADFIGFHLCARLYQILNLLSFVTNFRKTEIQKILYTLYICKTGQERKKMNNLV